MKGGKIMFNIFPKRKLTMTEEVLTTVISGAAFVVFVLATPIIEFAEFVREVFNEQKGNH